MGTIVETQAGKVEGTRKQGLEAFLGIPYAQPPVGALRFQAPVPAGPWAGVRDASSFGPSSLQNPMLLPLPGMDVGRTAEDCLYLNVYTPAADGARRPVLFWIHGGGFVIGSGSQPLYDGAPLVSRGDVVLVTINYRLGPLGFLFLGDLYPELEGAVANAGIRDQIAALEWVHHNIAAFGGDPDNVTIFGESAGGMSVGTLLGAPSAHGLFRRAVAQSGAGHNFHTRETATKVAQSFLDMLGVPVDRAERALRELPAQKLLDTQQQTLFKLGTSLGLLPFQPVVDRDVLPESPIGAVRGGQASGVTLLTGTTRDEWKLLCFLDPDVLSSDEEGLVAKLARRIPGVDSAELVATYRDARAARGEKTDPAALFLAIETDRIFRLPAIRLAEAQAAVEPRTFMYRFDWPSPAFGGALGACHAVELPFVFGTHAHEGGEMFAGHGPDADALAARTMDAWLSFARSGEPGHADLPDWPAYEVGDRATLVLDRACRLERAPADAERAFWDGVV